jgi:hypothetical protein
MANCKKCGQVIWICTKCGHTYCINKAKCGFSNSSGNKCPKCGVHAGKFT